jgi:hypothetical protein
MTELSPEAAAVLRDELRLMREDLADEGRRVAASAAILGGAGVLGLGAFGALTAAVVAALGQRNTASGALFVAAIYGAGAAALAESGVKRLSRARASAVDTLQRDVKTAAREVRRAA